ncbi:hypothetical protein G3N58_26145 [Paraburkholderia sp. Ac-20342]|uniref:hypothetical protein n=1 Tax=Paraburkholderia sp. Ac-20342 TaxID=2703889 RepID=UPI001980000B|nr:hypothetical protein [Paraburkholderia sp. Ac-20342]MBN3850275.1 hypothetical protein [Paraburkholderia sp. Ac-20342]
MLGIDKVSSLLTTVFSPETPSADVLTAPSGSSPPTRQPISGALGGLPELDNRLKVARYLLSSGIVPAEQVRTRLIPAIKSQQAVVRVKDQPPSIRPTSETGETAREQVLEKERASSEPAPAESPFSLAARSRNLKTLLAARHYDEPLSFDFSKMREAFWLGSSESVMKTTAPAVAQTVSDVTTALAWYVTSKTTGMIAGAKPQAAGDSVEKMPDGLSARNIVVSLARNTLSNFAYEGTWAAVHNGIEQLRASQRPRTELDPYQSKIRVHTKLMDESRDYMAQALDPLTQGKINDIDSQIVQCLQNPANGMKGLAQAELLMARREVLVGSRMVTRHGNEWLKSSRVRKELDELADFFPDSTADELKTVFFDKLGIESRPAVFLTGRGGVGKTQFVKNFSAVVKRPIVETTLEELLSPKFWGPPGDWSLGTLNAPLPEVAGILHAKKMEFGRNDVIVLVNEADFGDDEHSAKVADIKRIMDSDNFKQYTNGGARHDIDAIFIFTSNVRNNSIEALCRRIPEVTMKSGERQRLNWAEKVLTQELTDLRNNHSERFVHAVEAQVRRNMDFIREVGNATECGIAITGTVVRTSVRNSVRDREGGGTVTDKRARTAILSVFRSNLGSGAYEVLDALASNGDGVQTNQPARSRSLSF